VTRVNEVLRWQVANGVLHVRSHVDTTDRVARGPRRADRGPRERAGSGATATRAFPQEGIVSFPDGEKLLAEAARRGVDAIGANPAFRGHPRRRRPLPRDRRLDSAGLGAARRRALRRDRRRAVPVLRGPRDARSAHRAAGSGHRQPHTAMAATTPPTATSCSGSCPRAGINSSATRW